MGTVYIHDATDREARLHNLIILELRTQPSGKGKFLYSTFGSSQDYDSLRLAMTQLEQWAINNGYEIAGVA